MEDRESKFRSGSQPSLIRRLYNLLRGKIMTYEVILEVRVRSDRLSMLNRMAERLSREPHEFELPLGHTKWDAPAVASMLLSMEIDEIDGMEALDSGGAVVV